MTSMARSRRLIAVAEALYRTVTLEPDAKLSDLSKLEQRRYLLAAEHAWEYVGPDLMRTQP